MKADLKTKWTAALRSGNYKQGRGRLKNGDDYCCLGVLCEVAGLSITDEGHKVANIGYEPLEDIGVPVRECFCRNDGIAGHKKMTFPQIADWLEKTL